MSEQFDETGESEREHLKAKLEADAKHSIPMSTTSTSG